MNYWIFQSATDRYDLRDIANFHPNMDGWWYATRYRNKMKPGDTVFFWMAGDKHVRGIYGVGKISSEPYADGDVYKVNIHVTKRLEKHISSDDIKQKKELQNLMIFRIAVGSNFLINESEGTELKVLIGENS